MPLFLAMVDPDIRWVGNEQGWANETNWSSMRRDEIYPGWPRYIELRSGHEDGTHWLPAEADVSIRPGWYYHASEDHQVKTLPHLLDIYYQSVGRNSNLLLNLPVDNRGLVHEKDVTQLKALREQLDKDFAIDLADSAEVKAADVRGNSSAYAAKNVSDGDPETYWATNDAVTKTTITFAFEKPTEVNRMVIQEYIPLGQRVENFIVEAEINGEWKEIDGQTTIGYKRIVKFNTVEATKIRLLIMSSKASLAISTIQLYRAPNLLTEPLIQRNKEGMVSLTVPDDFVEIYYTLDGSEPSLSSNKYKKSFLIDKATTVKAISFDPKDKLKTQPISTYFDLNKSKWEIVEVSSGNILDTDKMIDDNPNTFWATDEGVDTIQQVVIDLGEQIELSGFTYLPMQDRYAYGIVTNFDFFVSSDNEKLEKSSTR